MADRTHPNDTSTPAMSDETVPREELVLVPREPTKAMMHGFLRAGPMPAVPFVECYRAMIDAAPAPNPSPAAKGGEAVREATVEPLKWARTTDPSEGSVHYGTGVFGHWYAASRVKPKVWSVNHHIDGKNVIVGLFESLQSAYAAAQSDYDCRIRAALSTPTEGPASQTEGMGGDAGAIRSAAFRLTPDEQHGLATALAANLGYDLTPEPPHPDAPGPGRFEAAAEKAFAASGEDTAVVVPEAIAALTPPETAEAVSDDLTAAYMAGVERGRDELRAERDDAVNMAAALAEVVASSEYKLESGDRYSVSLYTANRMVDLARHLLAARAAAASDPAPATDDRERLVKALREAAAPFVRHYADWMNKWPDDQEASVFLRHTYGEIRALRAALATEASR